MQAEPILYAESIRKRQPGRPKRLSPISACLAGPQRCEVSDLIERFGRPTAPVRVRVGRGALP